MPRFWTILNEEDEPILELNWARFKLKFRLHARLEFGLRLRPGLV